MPRLADPLTFIRLKMGSVLGTTCVTTVRLRNQYSVRVSKVSVSSRVRVGDRERGRERESYSEGDCSKV